MMDLTKEEQIIYAHFEDMYKLANKRSMPVFSNFLSLNEMEIIYNLFENKNISKNILKDYVNIFGGYNDAERKMVCFLPDNRYQEVREEDFPIGCVRITPVNKKFCDVLSHRDFLGTVMSIGIERNQIGDIIVKKDDDKKSYTGYIFCCIDKVPLFLDITKVRHTSVITESVDGTNLSLTQEYKDILGSVPSMRLDAITAVAVKMSRSRCLSLIKDGNVYINGRICTQNSKIVCDSDILSIRGYGKYKVKMQQYVTKKGRYHITIQQYI